MKNDITAVRNLLIEGMERLLNPEEKDSFTIDKAKALAQIGAVVVESAKAEALFLAKANYDGVLAEGTGFMKNKSIGTGQ